VPAQSLTVTSVWSIYFLLKLGSLSASGETARRRDWNSGTAGFEIARVGGRRL